VLPRSAEPSGLPQVFVADAAVEADPIDTRRAAAGIPVALVDSWQRRMPGGNEFRGVAHRIPLLTLAARLPLAIDADVEKHGIVERRGAARPERTDRERKRGKTQQQPRDDH